MESESNFDQFDQFDQNLRSHFASFPGSRITHLTSTVREAFGDDEEKFKSYCTKNGLEFAHLTDCGYGTTVFMQKEPGPITIPESRTHIPLYRVLRILEYTSTNKDALERQVARSVHGEKTWTDGRPGGKDGQTGAEVTLRAATVGTYPELIQPSVVVKRAETVTVTETVAETLEKEEPNTYYLAGPVRILNAAWLHCPSANGRDILDSAAQYLRSAPRSDDGPGWGTVETWTRLMEAAGEWAEEEGERRG